MSSVYDVIDELREAKHLSMRKLAELAGIKPTTLVSMMKRRPDTIKSTTLANIAAVFGVKWYQLIGKTEDDPVARMDDVKVQAAMSELEKEDIVDQILNAPFEMPSKDAIIQDAINMYVQEVVNVYADTEDEDSPKKENDSVVLRGGIYLMLNQLNRKGLLKVMAYVLDVAQDSECSKQDMN